MRSQKKQPKKKPEERNNQLLRLIELISYLEHHVGREIADVAQHVGKGKKTIYRDFRALEAAGIPLENELRDKKKFWSIDFKGKNKKLSSLLDAHHYLALRVAMEPGASITNSSPTFATLEDLSQKIEKALGSAGKGKLAAIEEAFHSYEKHAYKDTAPDVLWKLVDAIHEKRLCRVTYRAPSCEPVDKTYEVLPLKIFAYDSALYLMCHYPKGDRQLKLNLQRLQSLEVLKRRGRVPRDFNPEALENDAFRLVADGPLTTFRLRFDKHVAPFIRERVWHPSQKLRELPDHELELEFRCAGSYEVGAWVQSWGDGVEVLAPKALRAEMRELGESLVEKYRDRPGQTRSRKRTLAR